MSDAVTLRDLKTRYDRYCKKLLTHSDVLALILANCVPEFRGMDLHEVADHIIDASRSSNAVVDEVGTNMIVGLANEDRSVESEPIIYDMRFRARIPEGKSTDGKLIAEMFVNVEAQNDFNPGYYLHKRATYYVSRLISSQKGTFWHNSDYNKIRKVYSIWLCMNHPNLNSGFINHYGIVENRLFGNASFSEDRFTDFNFIVVGLNDTSSVNNMVKALSGYFSDKTSGEEKCKYLEDAGIKVSAEIQKEAKEMCNFSDNIERKGVAKGMAQGMAQSIANLMDSLRMSYEEAAKALKVSSDDLEIYRALVEKYIAKSKHENA